MPNWVVTKVVATEPHKIVEALAGTRTLDNGEVLDIIDFNKLIPMPKDLEDVTKGSCSFNPDMPPFTGENSFPTVPTMLQAYDKTISQKDFVKKLLANKEFVKAVREHLRYKESDSFAKEAIESFIKGFFNHKRYGFIDWYDWSVENWGTKWNARVDSAVIDDEWGIEFETAWSVPAPLLMELAKICPIRVAYADEDLGHNCGVYDIFVDENGEVQDERIMDSSEELSRVLWGYTSIDDFWEITKSGYNKMKRKMNIVETQLNELMTVEQLKKDFEEVL